MMRRVPPARQGNSPALVDGIPAPSFRLEERMQELGAPGVSIAVVDEWRVVWARGFGRRIVTADAPVTPATLFQAASIGKAIFATASLRLVDQRRLELDRDVNEVLRSWKVPENEHTAREKVTLRRILSHTAGTNVHGFVRVPGGGRSPTLPELLEGKPPAVNEPVRVIQEPGRSFRYSGGGVLIETLLIAETMGSPRGRGMRRPHMTREASLILNRTLTARRLLACGRPRRTSCSGRST